MRYQEESGRMNILVTGAGGFIGKHLSDALKGLRGVTVFESFHDTKEETLSYYLSKCDFIYHLAGVNRSEKESDFEEGNTGSTKTILKLLKLYDNICPVLYTSSIHAVRDTPYGRSKREAEELLFQYERETGGQVYIYRLTNLFGKGARPNYNSVVATFCHNIAHGLPIDIHNRDTVLTLCYIDDAVEEFLQVLHRGGHCDKNGYYYVPKVHRVSLGTLSELLLSFQKGRVQEKYLNAFEKALYRTYLSYIQE